MKHVLVFTAVAAFFGAHAQTIISGGGWAPSSPFNRLYNTSTVVTFSGKVTGIQVSPPMADMSAAVSLLIKADNGGNALVHVGPAWFVQNQEPAILIKDRLTVTGSKIFINGKSAILASTITKGDRMLVLRDKNGVPLWAAWRDVGTAFDNFTPSGVEIIDGEIVELTTFAQGQAGFPNQILVVQSDQGRFNVDLGPTWFIQGQAQQFQVGDAVIVNGMRGSLSAANPIIIANHVRRGGQALVLRYANGVPIWEAWRGT